MEAMLIGLLILVVILWFVALGAWIGLFRMVILTKKKNRVGIVFLHLLAVIFVNILLHYYIVGYERCSGFLCGIEEVLLFLFIMSFVIALWPFAVLIYYRWKDKQI